VARIRLVRPAAYAAATGISAVRDLIQFEPPLEVTETGAFGILADVFPFVAIRLIGAEKMIEETLLPEWFFQTLEFQLPAHRCSPCTEESREVVVVPVWWAAKEMDVVRHHYDATDQPLEKCARFTDLIEHQPNRTFVREQLSPLVGATGNEVNNADLVR
jgi:hypothetical protein